MNKLQWYLKHNTVRLIPEYAFENVCIIKVEDRNKKHGWIVSECLGQMNKSDDVISMPYAFQGMPSMKAEEYMEYLRCFDRPPTNSRKAHRFFFKYIS